MAVNTMVGRTTRCVCRYLRMHLQGRWRPAAACEGGGAPAGKLALLRLPGPLPQQAEAQAAKACTQQATGLPAGCRRHPLHDHAQEQAGDGQGQVARRQPRNLRLLPQADQQRPRLQPQGRHGDAGQPADGQGTLQHQADLRGRARVGGWGWRLGERAAGGTVLELRAAPCPPPPPPPRPVLVHR